MDLNLLSSQLHDLTWITQTRIANPRAPIDKDAVFEDEEIRRLLHESPHLRPHIQNIVDEIAHKWSANGIRFVGYFVAKILRRICSALLVNRQISFSPDSPLFWVQNEELGETINRLCSEAPVLYLPSHRSYADFIVLSYVCFSMGLPLPSIAAGTDFLSLNQAAALLRACGAFFIRRSSLKSDPLYWKTFKAYAEQLIMSGERPVEFFLEGTRSRSGKSLPPKTGLLSIAVNLFLSGAITDLIVIPVSISYDRILEENLYVQEISPDASGGKPNETTTHLIQGAKSIKNQTYGSVHVRFREPISVRHLLKHGSNSDIRKRSKKCPEIVSSFVTKLANDVIREQVLGTSLSAFDLFSFIVIAQHANHAPDYPPSESQLTVSVRETLKLMEELIHMIPGENLAGMSCDSLRQNLSNCLQIHEKKFISIEEHQLTMKYGVMSLNMRIYANKLLQVLIDQCICTHVQTLENFILVKQILVAEFCSLETPSDASFSDSRHSISSITSDLSSIMSSYITYYLKSYLQVCVWSERICAEDESLPLNSKSLTRKAARELRLSSDVISGFQVMVHQRMAVGSSIAIIKDVLREERRKIVSLLPNCNMVAGDAECVQSKL